MVELENPEARGLSGHPAMRSLSKLIGPWSLTDEAKIRAAVTGKVIVITGASYGVGAASARLLGRLGARVVVGARTIEKLEEVVADIRATGGEARAIPLDLTDEASVLDFAAAVLAEYGHVDCLVLNAGKSMRRSIELSYGRPKDITSTTGANYVGPMRLTMAFLPSMTARRSGHIVNVSTIGTFIPFAPKWGFYVSSKLAFETWLRAVAMETRFRGVTLTTINPGLIHTRMSAPSTWMRYTPGHTADDYAYVIARAVVQKPRKLAPVYSYLLQVGMVALQWPTERIIEQAFRFLPDTATSRSAAHGEKPVTHMSAPAPAAKQ